MRVIEQDGSVSRISCRAKGVLRRDEEKVLVGDEVKIRVSENEREGIVISELLPRRNMLIRPPLANLDYLFIVISSKKPTPTLETVDKLLAIAEHNKIEPVVIITKSDLSEECAEEYRRIYELSGYTVFVTSSEEGEGIAALKEYIEKTVKDGKTAAFAGASGVGKSTLMNALFQGLSLATSEISQKIERGRHTTRHVEIYEISEGADTGLLADTPGFSMIDFSRFDFFALEDLADSFREIRAYTGRCRYADCAHVGEGASECAVARAAMDGEIAESRLESYRSIYRVLKEKATYG